MALEGSLEPIAGALGSLLEPLVVVLGRSWILSGCSWELFGLLWKSLRAISEALAGSWIALSCMLAVLEWQKCIL